MTFLEKDLEQIIFETDNDLLTERGLHISGRKYRQMKIGNYGIADLITFYKVGYNVHLGLNDVYIEVFEIKKEEVNLNTFMQAVRYVKGIQRYFEKRKFDEPIFHYNITLIGKSVNMSEFVYLPDIFENVTIYQYSYEFDGLKFKQIYDYSLQSEGF